MAPRASLSWDRHGPRGSQRPRASLSWNPRYSQNRPRSWASLSWDQHCPLRYPGNPVPGIRTVPGTRIIPVLRSPLSRAPLFPGPALPEALAGSQVDPAALSRPSGSQGRDGSLSPQLWQPWPHIPSPCPWLSGSLQNGSHWAFSFDMSSLSSSQEVSLAQLRVRLPRAHNVSLDIYHSQRRRCRGDGTCAHQLFLGTVAGSPSATQASWKVFEVTNLLRSWLHQAALPGHPSATGRAQWDESGSIAPATTGHGDAADRVLLLVFSKDKSPGDHSLIRTAETSKYIMRDSGSQGAGTRRQRRTRMEKQRIKASEAVPREQGRELCRRVDMVVDFEQTGWGSWIVYPKKYNAYRCEGLCPSPVDETFKPTNHAYIQVRGVLPLPLPPRAPTAQPCPQQGHPLPFPCLSQSLLRLYKPNLVPCPACSPVKMSPLSMLYYERGEVVVRHHEDMIIEECGCN